MSLDFARSMKGIILPLHQPGWEMLHPDSHALVYRSPRADLINNARVTVKSHAHPRVVAPLGESHELPAAQRLDNDYFVQLSQRLG